MEGRHDPVERASARPSARRAWTETSGIVILTVLVSSFCRPLDPFFLEASFPWPVIAIILCGGRYGLVHGLASSVAIAATIFLTWRWGFGTDAPFPALYCTGLVLTGMLVGEFYDKWDRRIQCLSAASQYCRQRLDEFARTYHLLKVSHDRLEHSLVGNARSLRGAILSMRRQMFREKFTDTSVAPVDNVILNLFSTYGRIRVGCLFEVDADGHLVFPARASLGNAREVAPGDVILQRALGTKKLVSVHLDSEGEGEKRLPRSSLLAAVPLVDVQGRIWGVVAVQDIPFASFQSDILLFLAVLGGYIGDTLRTLGQTVSGEIDEEVEFQQEVRRSIADRQNYRMPAVVIGMHIRRSKLADDFISAVVEARRGLDRILVEQESSGARILFLLMPQTDNRGLVGYERRLHELVREKFLQGLDDIGVRVCRAEIDGVQSAETVLADLREKVGVTHELS